MFSGERLLPIYVTKNLRIKVLSENTYIDNHGNPRVLCHIRPHPAIPGILVARARLKMTDKLKRRLSRNEIVHHKNEITDDDRPRNLKLVSRGEHQRMHRLGTKQSAETVRKKIVGMRAAHRRGAFRHISLAGESSPHAKLKWAQVLRIRRLRANGYTNGEVAEMFEVSVPTISMIHNRKTWRKAR